jgi:hypothetical protein
VLGITGHPARWWPSGPAVLQKPFTADRLTAEAGRLLGADRTY